MISVEEFDRRFDNGESVLEHLDFTRVKRGGVPIDGTELERMAFNAFSKLKPNFKDSVMKHIYGLLELQEGA